MAQRDPLTGFVEAALDAGRGRGEIRAALSAAGWTEREVEDALTAFADTAFLPPVPRPRPVVSARDFFTYALIAISLGVAAVNLVDLLHEAIDALAGEPRDEWAVRSRNWSLAALIVFGPIYAVLSRAEAARRETGPGRQRSAIRKWTVTAILLATVLALLGTLAWGVYVLLNDGFAVVELMKVAATAAVAAGIWWAYRGERDG
jgi:hypothetical protein